MVKNYGKMVMFIKINFFMRKDKVLYIDFWKKKLFCYIKSNCEVWRGWEYIKKGLSYNWKYG